MRPDTPAGPHRPGALPNLIVAGYAKCGTSSIHQYLGSHPDIAMSVTKEVGFFCDYPDPDLINDVWRETKPRTLAAGTWPKGEAWYRTHFDPAAPWRGESSPAYTSFFHPRTPERIAAVLPDPRIILCVRDPVERVLSQHRFLRARGFEKRPAPVALNGRDSPYVRTGGYSVGWSRLVSAVGSGAIHIVETERLAADPGATMDAIFGWLGLEGGIGDEAFSRRWNETAIFTSPGHRLIEAVRRLPGWGHVGERLPSGARYRWERLLARGTAATGRSAAAQAETDEVREHLRELLAPEAERFRSLTGRGFEHWSV